MNDSRETPGTPDRNPGGAGAADAPAADTRAALIEAARTLFAEQGYDGASVRAITGRAGANLAAVTYHFGSKEALYHEVVASMMHPIRDRILEVARGGEPPLDRLDAVVATYFRHFADYPDLPHFLIERIASGQLPPPPVLETMSAVLRAVSGIVAEGQAEGSIRPGDPVLMTLSLISQPVYLTLVQQPLRTLTRADISTDALVAHARAFVRAGLALTPPSVP